MTIKARSGNGRAARAPETVEQDQRAWELHVARLTEREIAAQLELAKSTVHDSIKRGRALNRSPEAAELKKDELAELDRISRQLWAIALDDHPKVDHGRVIYLPNPADPSNRKVLLDKRINMQAYRELRMVQGRRASLLGLDAPAQHRVDVITEDVLEANIRRLEAELGLEDRLTEADL